MHEIDLYQPSLTKGWKLKRSYDIKNFLLVAIFGGAMPLMILGSINAKWLGVFRKAAFFLIPIALLLEITKWTLFILFDKGIISISDGTVNIAYIVGCVLLYVLYMFLMREPFQYYKRTGGQVKPLLLPALMWIFITIAVEVALNAIFM